MRLVKGKVKVKVNVKIKVKVVELIATAQWYSAVQW